MVSLSPKRNNKRLFSSLTKPKRKDLENEEVESSDDDEILPNEKERKTRISDDDDEEAYETAHEKRYRLAKEYLSAIEEQEREKAESSTIDQDAIAHRLKEDVLSKAGKLHKKIASQLNAPIANQIKILKGHKLSPTCVATTSDDLKCVTGSKDGTIIVWDISNGKKLKSINGLQRLSSVEKSKERGQVFCLAISPDQKFLCSGSSDSLIRVWDFNSMTLTKEFTGHKGPVTGLVFRQGHNQLFSCGHDRSVKIWNLDEMGYVDTMFGHQDAISSIDALSRERAITSGSRDRSIRIWKIVEESQLVFNAHSKCGSVECLSLINEDHFVSGADDGSISVWSVMKKKPVCHVENAHSLTDNSETCWMSAVKAAKFTDLIASGSRDGQLKLWCCSENYKSLTLLHSVSMPGSINDLCFSSDCSKVICAVGQEHKMGRWWRQKDAKNAIFIVPLTYSSQD